MHTSSLDHHVSIQTHEDEFTMRILNIFQLHDLSEMFTLIAEDISPLLYFQVSRSLQRIFILIPLTSQK
jgi:hypothetical protein